MCPGMHNPPTPLRKHGRVAKSQVKTAVQRPPRAKITPCMRATHVTAKHARGSNLTQGMAQCTSNSLNVLLVLIHCRGHRVDRVQMDVVVPVTRGTNNSGRCMFPVLRTYVTAMPGKHC